MKKDKEQKGTFSEMLKDVFAETLLRTWMTEIQQSDWLVAVVYNSTDHAVDNHVLKTIDSKLDGGLLSLKHFKLGNVLTHSRKYYKHSASIVFLNFPFVSQNISTCLKLNRPLLVIAYCYTCAKEHC